MACALLASCAGPGIRYDAISSLTAQGRYLDAAGAVEDARRGYGDRGALLYYLDRGFLLHIGGEYAASNESLAQAKRLADAYFTKSVTTEASTLLISDLMRPYYGEDFERAKVYVFSALNYLMLGRPEDALVEARQADHFLKTLQVNYGQKNRYKEDPFARYLLGLIYEDQGQLNDAFISYRQALDAYRATARDFALAAPQALIGDALRTARQLGFADEVRDIMRSWPGARETQIPLSYGELVVVQYGGFAPEKVETIFEIAFGRAWLYVDGFTVKGEEQTQVEQARGIARSILFDEQVRMAFPKYERIPSRISRFRAVAGEASAGAELADDIGAVAIKSLEDRIARIRARTIARAAIKFALARKISQKVEQQSGNEVLGWLAKKALTVASTATEHADRRSWRSLPDRIYITRLPLYAGTHTVTVTCYDDTGVRLRTETLRDIVITPGKKTFAIVRAAL